MNIRRYYISNSIYFTTAVTRHREPVLEDGGTLDIFRETLQNVKVHHPFIMEAYVFLPDHFHFLIKPVKTANITEILHSIQRNFTVNFKKAKAIAHPLRLWQHRFWDHVIRNENDYEGHFHYIHYNPVKHGYVTTPEDWPHSSYRYYMEEGYYQIGWGYTEPEGVKGMNLE